ncbi:hypothetical protein FJ977_16005 [Mesorhizobium sp. B2-1-3A]|nr:hypothetical protein FJ977_16005 [Mesorhizobium sp. B2-1-3A]
MLVNRLRRLGKIKFATWVANGQLLFAMPRGAASTVQTTGKMRKGEQKRRRGRSQAALQS